MIIAAGNITGGTAPVITPVADFQPRNRTVPAGAFTPFQDQSLNSPTSWQWSINGAVFSIVQNPSLYLAAGDYTIELIAANSAGLNTKTAPLTAA